MPFMNTYDSRQFGRWTNDTAYVHMLLIATSEIINELDLSQLDIDFANQYSTVYNCPWAVDQNTSDSRMLQQFMTKNSPIINSYLIRKCASALSTTVSILRSNLSAGIIDKILAENKSGNTISEDGDESKPITEVKFRGLIPLLITTAMSNQLDIVLRMFKDFTGKTASISRGFDRVSRLQDLMSHMNVLERTFSIHHRDYATDRPLMTLNEGTYLRNDQMNALLNMAEPMILDVYKNSAGSNAKNSLDIIKLINSALTVVLHTFVLNYNGTIVDEEDFYRRFVTGGDSTSEDAVIMKLIRPYSEMSLPYVLQMPLYVTGTAVDKSIAAQNSVAPGSLQERYLFYYVRSMLNYPKDVTNVPVLAEMRKPSN